MVESMSTLVPPLMEVPVSSISIHEPCMVLATPGIMVSTTDAWRTMEPASLKMRTQSPVTMPRSAASAALMNTGLAKASRR